MKRFTIGVATFLILSAVSMPLALAGGSVTVATPTATSNGSTATGAMFVSSTNATLTSAPLLPKPDGSKQRWTCRFFHGAGPSSSPYFTDENGGIHHVNESVTPVKGVGYVLICTDETGAVVYRNEGVVYDPGNPAAMLAGADGGLNQSIQQALTEVRALAPRLVTSPPIDRFQVIGVQTWFWLETWDPPLPGTAGAQGFSITVTAEPIELTIDPGDGSSPITCSRDDAQPWSKDGPQRTRCGHTYQHSSRHGVDGRYPVTATLTYTPVWRATDPAGAVIGEGPLAPITSDPATVPLEVREIQAVGR